MAIEVSPSVLCTPIHIQVSTLTTMKTFSLFDINSVILSEHEKQLGEVAASVGFTHISLSNEIMPMIKIVPRGTSTTADSYLTPCIQNYIKGFVDGFDDGLKNGATSLQFMQSDGGLVPVDNFSGFRAILSGPAGGVVGYALTTYSDQQKQPVIGFDMGGTSTGQVFSLRFFKCMLMVPSANANFFSFPDVSRFDGHYEHVFETTTAGVTIQAPQLDINTVAAGGGSMLFYKNGMFVVGPEVISSWFI
jgi:5-oxoprolinase (ATP-hydrolysing)